MDLYRQHFRNSDYLKSFTSGTVLLFLSLVLQFYVSTYVSYRISDPVTDIILSNTRVYDVDGLFVWGAVLLFLFIFYLCATNPKNFPFIMKSVALFTIIRSIFLSLTHLSPFPNHVLISSTFFSKTIFSGVFNYNDLFFSGHTGMPFLFALMFWDNKILRYIFLAFSVLMGVTVLLGHLHYSIDVASAFFITYGIFDICKFFFKNDWELFKSSPVVK